MSDFGRLSSTVCLGAPWSFKGGFLFIPVYIPDDCLRMPRSPYQTDCLCIPKNHTPDGPEEVLRRCCRVVGSVLAITRPAHCQCSQRCARRQSPSSPQCEPSSVQNWKRSKSEGKPLAPRAKGKAWIDFPSGRSLGFTSGRATPEWLEIKLSWRLLPVPLLFNYVFGPLGGRTSCTTSSVNSPRS